MDGGPARFRGDSRRFLRAYAADGVDVLLATHVAARLRERDRGTVHSTMVERLPRWLKARDNRTEILRVIAHLRASLPG
ncbi:hypothetical protein [Asanoa sp. NPDC050611]|uniref:hypothetical protein n=1 Tax=Asanoa sp. NPDC050611 TaxID=3157098 RepID=UPI0033E8FF3E